LESKCELERYTINVQSNDLQYFIIFQILWGKSLLTSMRIISFSLFAKFQYVNQYNGMCHQCFYMKRNQLFYSSLCNTKRINYTNREKNWVNKLWLYSVTHLCIQTLINKYFSLFYKRWHLIRMSADVNFFWIGYNYLKSSELMTYINLFYYLNRTEHSISEHNFILHTSTEYVYVE
jgi:hypothetical protein